MKEPENDKRNELLRAHIAEMNEPVSKDTMKFKIVTREQIKKLQMKYVTICAEYAACKGIYDCYHAAGLDELADPFAKGALIAGESAQAVAEMLDILGLDHTPK